jgi:pyruvate-formate lyase-activating enzyme
MIFSDRRGRIYDHPRLHMAGQSGTEKLQGNADRLTPLPEGSELFSLPGRRPVGCDPGSKEYVTVEEIVIDGQKVECTAVAAFLAPGYLRLLLPATQLKRNHPILPLWAYGAVGWREDGLWASGFCLDSNPHWNPKFFKSDVGLKSRVRNVLRRHPRNRLFHHLSHCALGYHCFAAKNVFYQRWEAPLPTSPGCNAECLGCLSFQPSAGCQPSHLRISFVPTVGEIVEVALPHMEKGEASIVSFGQGCEGEPLLQDRLLEETIGTLRKRTTKGTINLNTNGSLPDVVQRLARAGLDSLRVTLGSATPERYMRFHQPQGYHFNDVVESIQRAKAEGIYVSLNLLVFPGVTDREDEIDSLMRLIRATGVDMIQMRNLNIDPEWYLKGLGHRKTRGIGLSNMLALLRQALPHLEIGYFNQTKEAFSRR